jgi:hypothetical protein
LILACVNIRQPEALQIRPLHVHVGPDITNDGRADDSPVLLECLFDGCHDLGS